MAIHSNQQAGWTALTQPHEDHNPLEEHKTARGSSSWEDNWSQEDHLTSV